MENTFFKFSGMTAMSENKRADAERIMAHWFGKQRGKSFAKLGAHESRIMQAFGIGDRPRYFLLAFAAVWPILLNTAAGGVGGPPCLELRAEPAAPGEHEAARARVLGEVAKVPRYRDMGFIADWP
jgi:hypothetical protein